jgi:hypothetical protein
MKSVLASYRLMVHLKVALEPFDTRPSQYQVGQYRALLLRLLKAFILVRLDAASHHARRASTGHSTEPRTMAIGAPVCRCDLFDPSNRCIRPRESLAHQQFSSSS